jgi:hypothetical protein
MALLVQHWGDIRYTAMPPMTTTRSTASGDYAKTWNRWSLNWSRKLDASLKSCK